MVHLADILEQARSSSLRVAETMPDEIGLILEREILNIAPSAVCFDMGEISAVTEMKAVTELIRLPYPTCWCEGLCPNEKEGNVRVGFLSQEVVLDGQKRLYTIMLHKHPENPRWVLKCVVFWWVLPDGNERVEIRGHNDTHFARLEDALHLWLRVFLSVLNCSNVEKQEHKPPRAMRRHPTPGKLLFSWWTLHVPLPGNRKESSGYGGTHASPRLHLRRGHMRQYTPGKWCWVQAHVVGNKELGMIHKDYAADFHVH